MRKRTPDPTTSPTPSEPPRFVITEKGLRACGAIGMEKTAAQLRQMADELDQAADRLILELPSPEDTVPRPRSRRRLKMVRYGTVCGRFREASKARVPDLRLSGLWLRGAGFDLGRKYDVEVEDDKLTIRARPRRPSDATAGSPAPSRGSSPATR